MGLLNVLEERDVQIRGYKIRLPLDLMLFASANPEDYTNRGRIITPLKDRFGAQIRTHYPLDVDVEMDVVEQEAVITSPDGYRVAVPEYMTEIVAGDQSAGTPVAARQPALRCLGAHVGGELRDDGRERDPPCGAQRRAGGRAPGERSRRARRRRTSGKIEFETVDDGREEQVLDRIVKAAVLDTFRATCKPEKLTTLVNAFDEGLVVHTGDDVPAAEYASLLSDLPGLKDTLADLEVGETPAGVASAVEFVLEGLHLSKRLNKDEVGGKAAYRGRG